MQIASTQETTSFWLTIALSELTCYLSNDGLIGLLPHISRQLTLPISTLQWLFFSWFLGAIIAKIWCMFTRGSHRTSVIIGMLILGISSFGLMHKQPVYLILLLRLLQGSASGIILVCGYSLIHQTLTHSPAIQCIARIQSISRTAPVTGPLLGWVCLYLADWHWLMPIIGASAVILSLCLYLTLPKPDAPLKKPTKNFKITTKIAVKIMANKYFLQPALLYMTLMAIVFFWLVTSATLLQNFYHLNYIQYCESQWFIFCCFSLGAYQTSKTKHSASVKKLIKPGCLSVFLGLSSLAISVGLCGTAISTIVCAALIFYGQGQLLSRLNRICAIQQPQHEQICLSIFNTFSSIAGCLISLLFIFSPINLTTIPICSIVFSIGTFLIYRFICIDQLNIQNNPISAMQLSR